MRYGTGVLGDSWLEGSARDLPKLHIETTTTSSGRGHAHIQAKAMNMRASFAARMRAVLPRRPASSLQNRAKTYLDPESMSNN